MNALRPYDIKEAIKLNNPSLNDDLSEFISIATCELIEQYGEEYANEIINKVINTKFFVAKQNVRDKNGKKTNRVETVKDVLRDKKLKDFVVFSNGENNPCFVSMPFIDGGEVVDTSNYLVVPSNYNVDHYDFQGKIIGELNKLATSTPYRFKRNKLETSMLLSNVTFKNDGTTIVTQEEVSEAFNEAITTNIMRENHLDEYSKGGVYNSDSYLIGNAILEAIGAQGAMTNSDIPEVFIEMAKAGEISESLVNEYVPSNDFERKKSAA